MHPITHAAAASDPISTKHYTTIDDDGTTWDITWTEYIDRAEEVSIYTTPGCNPVTQRVSHWHPVVYDHATQL